MQTNLTNGINTFVDPMAYKNQRPLGKSELDSQDFLNLLVTQMKNQDPLQPMDNADFTQQTTMFSQLEELVGIGDAIEKLASSQQANTNTLFSSASFIGKGVEYATNTVELGGSSLPTMQFVLPEDPTSVEIRIYNKEGAAVSVLRPTDAQRGSNTIQWDGTGLAGTKVPDGRYSFEVVAMSSENVPMDVRQNGAGIVQGVEMVGGQIYLDLGGFTISSTDVIAVREAEFYKQADSSESATEQD